MEQSKKEKAKLLEMVAALLVRNPEDLKSYRELVGYSEAFGPNDPTAAAAYGGSSGARAGCRCLGVSPTCSRSVQGQRLLPDGRRRIEAEQRNPW